jgi:hypothetical protein
VMAFIGLQKYFRDCLNFFRTFYGYFVPWEI